MSDAHKSLSRAEELRRAFDRGFSDPVERSAVETEDFLLLRLATAHHAIRLSEVSGLFVDRVVTSLPGSPPTLVGISGFRGVVLPVYDFLAVLGQGRAEAPRWMMILAAAPLALAFDEMLGHRRVAVSEIRRDVAADRPTGRARELVPADEGHGHIAVVDLQGVIATIMRGNETTP